MWQRRSKGLALSLALFSSLVITRPAFGQSITGDILGTVHDAVVPSAKVTVTAVDTGIKFEPTSDESATI